eukprot:11479375-Alexandrium_andersonii.AAC.1
MPSSPVLAPVACSLGVGGALWPRRGMGGRPHPGRTSGVGGSIGNWAVGASKLPNRLGMGG